MPPRSVLFPLSLLALTLLAGVSASQPVVAQGPLARIDLVEELDVDSDPPPTVVLDVLANDEHPDGLPFALKSFTVPSSQIGGTLHQLAAAPGTFLFTPTPGLNHSFRFDYEIEDPAGNVDSQSAWFVPEGALVNIGSPNFGLLQIVSLTVQPGPEVRLEWAYTGSGNPSFTISRGPTTSSLSTQTTTAAGARLHKDAGVVFGQTYCYQVSMQSPQVAESEVSCVVADDSVVSFLKLDAINPAGPTALNVLWSYVGDATSLEVLRSVSGVGGVQVVATPSPTSGAIMDTGLQPETTYCYQVRTVGATVYQESGLECRTTDALGSTAPNPGPPVQVTVSGGQASRNIADLLVNATDPDGDDSKICFDNFTSATTAMGGQVFLMYANSLCKGGSATYIYQSPGGGITTDSFRFRIIDEAGETALGDAEVLIGVNPPAALLSMDCTGCPGCGPHECQLSALGSTDYNGDPIPEANLTWRVDGTALPSTPHLFHYTFPGDGYYTVELTVQDPFTQLEDTATGAAILGDIFHAEVEAACAADRWCTIDMGASTYPANMSPDSYTYAVSLPSPFFYVQYSDILPTPNVTPDPPYALPSPLPHDGPALGSSNWPYQVNATLKLSDGQGSFKAIYATQHFPATEYPPTPVFTEICDAVTGSCYFDARGSQDDHGIASYSWDFGDGSVGTEATPQHIYATTGSYEVSLMVTDTAASPQSQAISKMVHVAVDTAPVANFLVDCPTEALGIYDCDLDMGYSHDSGSGDALVYEVSASPKFVPELVTSTKHRIRIRQFPPFEISVRAMDSGGQWSPPKTRTLDLTPQTGTSAPQAAFEASCVPSGSSFTCTLDASASRDSDPTQSLQYQWKFDGDPFSDPSTDPVRVWNAGTGYHSITLRVTDSLGESDDYTRLIDLTGSGIGIPVAAMKAPSCSNGDCRLDGSLSMDDRPGLRYRWSLVNRADESVLATTEGRTADFEDLAAGTYGLRLEVTDSSGQTSTDQTTLVVNYEPVAQGDRMQTSGASVLIDVLANDTDPEGDTLTVEGLFQPLYGTAVIVGSGSDLRIRYTPGVSFAGEDAFVYLLSDGRSVIPGEVTISSP